MKKNCLILIAGVLLITGCKDKKNERVDTYTNTLDKVVRDSTAKPDTLAVNNAFKENVLPNLTPAMQLQSLTADNASLQQLVQTENKLLARWDSDPGFKPYTTMQLDTMRRLIRGCASFDRAPVTAGRIPAARGMRTLTLAFYQFTIPIAIHIIKSSNGNGQPADMNDRITRQVQLLNNEYRQFNITFLISSIDVTVNNRWFTGGSAYSDQNALREMTNALSRSPDKQMNVFLLAPGAVLGEATYPWDDVTRNTRQDYVVIHHNTISGGPSSFFNGDYASGKTMLHEVGHYLGLYHTFEGGSGDCQSNNNNGCQPGDYVDDTPGQKICYMVGCDESVDSCPDPGKDPVRNFMGYNPDACMREFTQGQGDRIKQTIIRYRPQFISNLSQFQSHL